MCLRCSEKHSDGIRTGFVRKAHEVFHVANELRRIESVFKADAADRLAAELSDLLIGTWSVQSKAFITELIREVKGSANFTEQDRVNIERKLADYFGAGFTALVSQPLFRANHAAYNLGIDSAGLKATFRLVDTDALNWLDNHQLYWVRSYYDRQLAEKVSKLGQLVISEGLNRSEAAQLFKMSFKDKFDPESYRYWDGFANHVTTRAREFGHTDAYVRANAKYLKVVAVLDHRTSGICKLMHNRIIKVEDALELKEKMMEASDPEDVKKIAPFLKEKDVIGKSTSQLKGVSNGYALPPYHFDCRSRTVVHRSPKTKVEFNAGDSLSKAEKELLGSYTDEEYQLYYNDLRRRKRFVYDDTLLERHKDRLDQLGLKNTGQISDFTRKLIRESDRFFIQAKELRGQGEGKMEIQFSFWNATHQVVLDQNYQVRLIIPHNLSKYGTLFNQWDLFSSKTRWTKN